MKLFAFVTVFFILISIVSVSAIEDNNYFSVSENGTYSCIFLNLPQDLDINRVDEPLVSKILSDREKSPWIDITDNEVLINPGMLTRTPVCFYHEGQREGSYSFYELNVSSDYLGVNKGVKGGICITKYEDMDESDNASATTNICDLLNSQADIFDAQFRYPFIEARPGEVIKNSVYVTSYAKIRISFSMETDMDNDLSQWTETADPRSPMNSKSFSIKAPDYEGTYNMILRAEIVGCGLDLCRSTTIGRVKVSENATRTGFVANVVPKNLNIKDASNVSLKLLITNYEEEMDFSISVSSEPGMKMTPETKSIIIKQNSFASVDFVAEPTAGSDTLYEISFNVLSENNEEHAATAYISFGELLTDAKREAEQIINDARENGDKETETFVLERLNEWEEERENYDYGEELGSYEDFKKSLDEAKKGNIPDKNTGVDKPLNKTTKGNDSPPPEPAEFNWLIVIIPLIIIIAIVAFFIYKRTQNISEKYEYPGFDEKGFDDGDV
ncbi:MAG: hypothetical protein JW716_01965 [Candidatus Aenigmarchaeota archaeon]|nr:hypothetical protein [Candidatus Aenigmarchaeota archaeon]